MNKKAIIKMSLGSLAIALILITIIFYSQQDLSSAAPVKSKYIIGERIKINTLDVRQIGILTPSSTNKIRNQGNSFIFIPEEEGNYTITLFKDSSQEKYYFSVFKGNETLQDVPIEQTNLTRKKKILRERVFSKDRKEIIVNVSMNETDEVLALLPQQVDSPKRVKLKWKEKDEVVNYELKDEDEDGLYDSLSFTTSQENASQEQQTFEIIIITKAEHLSSSREYISDIYDQVKEKDDVWSEDINSGEFVRVIFEKNLTKDKDITFFAKVISGSPILKVYQAGELVSFIEYSNIKDNEYNQILLTTLNGSRDDFDLEVLNGTLQFDHIIDPIITVALLPSQDIALAALDNRTFVVAWIQGGPLSLNYSVIDTNGTIINSGVVATLVDAESPVSVVAINSTNFVIAWTDSDAGSEDGNARGYTRTGGAYFAQFEFEAGIGAFLDIKLIAQSDRYHVCYTDSAEGDFDIKSYLYTTPTTLLGVETNLDGTAAPDTSLNNLIDCAAINSTRFAAVWLDDGTANDPAVYAILNNSRGTVTTQTTINNAGATGQVATTAINQNAFVSAYSSSVTGQVNFTITNKDNGALLGKTTVDNNASTSTRIALATVRNRTDNSDWFVIAWNDQISGNINASVYNSSGSQKYSYLLATDENTSSLIFDIYGKDSARNDGICDESYVFAYTNDTGGVTTKTLTLDGREWSGYCDFTNPLITVISPQNITYSTSSMVFNITFDDPASAVFYTLNGGITNISMSSVNLFHYNASNLSIADGNYLVRFYTNNTNGLRNDSVTVNFSILVDNTFPLIDYGIGTLDNGVNVSTNWIYVNVSITETNEKNITFNLFNTTTLINSTTFSAGNRTINWTGLIAGNYTYNVSVIDLQGNINWTINRNITIDLTNPSAILVNPLSASYSGSRLQNFTVNASDDLLLSNITLNVYNSSSFLVNQTTNSFSFAVIAGISVTLPSDGNFTWNYEVRDNAGNLNLTVNRTIIIDTIFPILNFTNLTLDNGTSIEDTSIFINVSLVEINFANITFSLFNTTSLLNMTTYTSTVMQINWTNLSSSNMTYYYNVSSTDLAGNINSTETRQIRLVDISLPSLSLVEPQNTTYYTNESLLLNYTVSDINLQSCWYNLDSTVNVTLANCGFFYFNMTEGSHTLYLFANDSVGLISSVNVTFTANASLLLRRPGILAYGEGTIQLPRYRLWNGTGFGAEINASSIGGTIEWLRAASSPVRDEHIIIAADSVDDVNLQINGSLPDGTSCWHNGTACGAVYQVTATSTTINRQKVDVSYETLTGDAMMVWSQGNITPAYMTWNGTTFSEITGIPQTLILAGVISYVKMESHPFRDEIALIMTNTTALNILIWNGTDWGCQPSALPSTVVTPEVFQHADLTYEQSSGDLFVASNVDAGVTEIDYTTKADGSCIYSTTRTTTLAEESEAISVGAKYASNYIMITQQDAGAEDLQAIVWNGTAMLAISGNEGTLLADATPNQEIASAWAGTSDYGLSIYSDAAVALTVDYLRYNISTNTWAGGTAGLDASGLTNFVSEERNIIATSYLDENKTMVIVKDGGSDLWAKTFNANTNSWSQPDGGVALETGASSANFQSFDFRFNYDRAGPQITIVSPSTYVNSSFVSLNVSLGERASQCYYSMNATPNIGMNSFREGLSYAINTSSTLDGVHNVSFTCVDIWQNVRTTNQFVFTVDTIFPILNFTNMTLNNGTSIERNFIFANISLVEINFANITFSLFNTTSLVNTTFYNTSILSINWTDLSQGMYFYNISVTDLAGNKNYTETRQVNLTRANPVVNLVYPLNAQNFSSFSVSQFNFTVNDDSTIANCSLYGNWTGSFIINQTLALPNRNATINFSSITTPTNGFYIWNVECTDHLGNIGRNSTNFTFATFLPPARPILLNITQNTKDGNGNVTLFWNLTSNTILYNIYYLDNLTSTAVLLNQTVFLNYTDTTFITNKRRFYRVESINPTGQNMSSDYLSAHVFQLMHSGNTRNWISLPTNATYIRTANQTLQDIRNATTFTYMNETTQKRVTCNLFTCPSNLFCTDTSCNFNLSYGRGYEVNINSSAPPAYNWSLVGRSFSPIVLSLFKNSTGFGKNWISMYSNTTARTARNLIDNITLADAVTFWDASVQLSRGFIKSPVPGIPYLGNNFSIILEQGYEVSVTATNNWTQT